MSTDCSSLQIVVILLQTVSLHLLLQDGIEVVEVGLGRVGSTNVTSHRVLQQIEESIADFMTRNPNAILSYMCDFINLVPSNKKITVQEYRSRMFSAMFKRYMSQHHIVDIYDDEIKIDGVAETFYFMLYTIKGMSSMQR